MDKTSPDSVRCSLPLSPALTPCALPCISPLVLRPPPFRPPPFVLRHSPSIIRRLPFIPDLLSLKASQKEHLFRRLYHASPNGALRRHTLRVRMAKAGSDSARFACAAHVAPSAAMHPPSGLEQGAESGPAPGDDCISTHPAPGAKAALPRALSAVHSRVQLAARLSR